MRILGRDIKLRSLPQKIREMRVMVSHSRQFKQPLDVWRHYLCRTSPASRVLKLRDGKRIFLSGNPHDPITAMVIFCRREYGMVPRDGVVVDIGANIGVFTIFAGLNGASRVVAVEPNQESFTVLLKNINGNSLGNVVAPMRKAISQNSDEVVHLPRSSSPYNKISGSEQPDLEPVETVSLENVIDGIEHVDLLKMDCEGAEYDVLMTCPDSILHRVQNLRIEIHSSKRFSKSDLIGRLQAAGFRLEQRDNLVHWFTRA